MSLRQWRFLPCIGVELAIDLPCHVHSSRCDVESLLQISHPQTKRVTCQLSVFAEDLLVSASNNTLVFAGAPDDFMLCEEATGAINYIVQGVDALSEATCAGEWITGTLQKVFPVPHNTTVPMLPWERDGSPVWQLVSFFKSKTPSNSVTPLRPPTERPASSSVLPTATIPTAPPMTQAGEDEHWQTRRGFYCADGWRAAWAARTLKPLADCKASCEASSSCVALTFGRYKGVDNNCVLCTGSWKQGSAQLRKVRVPSFLEDNLTGKSNLTGADVFPFYERFPRPAAGNYSTDVYLEQLRLFSVFVILDITTYVKQEGGWNVHNGTSCSGINWESDFMAGVAKSFPDCRSSCEGDDSCVAFTYFPNVKVVANCIFCTNSGGLDWKEAPWTTTYIKRRQLWDVKEQTYCSGNWRADWANRTVQPLADCQASCEASSSCYAMTFGTWRGRANNCVFCTGSKWRRATWTTSWVKKTTTTTTPRNFMDILMIICEFTDYKPDYVDERTAFAEIFGAFAPVYRYLLEAIGVDEPFGNDARVINDLPTMKNIIATESNNHLDMLPEKSKAVTVQMKVAWGGVTGCPHQQLAERALRMVREQHPHVDPDSYSFRELFIPASPSGGCSWDGLASKGCGLPRNLPSPGACLTWYRTNDRFVRLHELGHNLGLSHASGDIGSGVWGEYGDQYVNMGNGYGMAMFSSADRYHLGWLADGDGEVLEWTTTGGVGVFNLSAVHKPPRQPRANGIAVKIACPSCRSKLPKFSRRLGGYLWIDYSQHLPTDVGAVTIRLSRDVSKLQYRSQGTENWKMLLKEGDSFEVEGIAILLCHVDVTAQLATVVIADSLNAARASCLPFHARSVQSNSTTAKAIGTA